MRLTAADGELDRLKQPARSAPAASGARNRATRQLELARAELHSAIVADLAAGVRQIDLAAATGYTTARLRQIARAAGLPPA